MLRRGSAVFSILRGDLTCLHLGECFNLILSSQVYSKSVHLFSFVINVQVLGVHH